VTDAEYNALYATYQSAIKAIARKYGNTDEGLVEDLEQEGMICLWKLDISKATVNPDSYVRNALRNRMIDFLRRENPLRHDSLDQRLSDGEDIERLPDGKLILTLRRQDNMVDLWRDNDEIEESLSATEEGA
jgi:RNA polymerase sigma factor (sigma-70 family)